MKFCNGKMYNGPDKMFVRCEKCGKTDREKNEGDLCRNIRPSFPGQAMHVMYLTPKQEELIAYMLDGWVLHWSQYEETFSYKCALWYAGRVRSVSPQTVKALETRKLIKDVGFGKYVIVTEEEK